MSTDATIQADQTQNQSVEESAAPTKKTTTPSVDDLQRRVKELAEEAKQFRQSNAELKRRIQDEEEAKLAATGEYKTLFEKAQEELKAERENNKKIVGNMALKELKSAFRAEAMAAGCNKPEALEKLIGMDRLSKAVNGSLEVDPVLLKSMVEDSQKEFDFIFGKPAPSVRDANPGHQKPQVEKPIEQMNAKELEALFRKIA